MQYHNQCLTVSVSHCALFLYLNPSVFFLLFNIKLAQICEEEKNFLLLGNIIFALFDIIFYLIDGKRRHLSHVHKHLY